MTDKVGGRADAEGQPRAGDQAAQLEAAERGEREEGRRGLPSVGT
ncbi:MAG TPA: hypothetical protein VGE11_12945 [Pseudonocardia sp.]